MDGRGKHASVGLPATVQPGPALPLSAPVKRLRRNPAPALASGLRRPARAYAHPLNMAASSFPRRWTAWLTRHWRARRQSAAADPEPTAAVAAAGEASWRAHRFAWENQLRSYRLFVPDGAPPSPPLLVMLHGCKQDAADFARGTRMNLLARQHGCLVLYPEQLAKANRMRCWNWFDRAHQGHAGEPAMIAALTRQVAQAHGADPTRIYIGGLSAGGAMAAVVAALYPELFAALGVHSGLPAGAASNVVSAFSAMRRGGRGRPLAGRPPALLPTLVIHGQADDTVHPDNGERLTAGALAVLQSAAVALTCVDSVQAAGSARPAHVRRWIDAQGVVQLEQWTLPTGVHAWSGGDPAGSFTDPQGPDASQAMLAFFLQHRKATAGG